MWRFVQISDPHLGSQRDGQWNNGFICTMMPDVIRCLKGDLAELQPDFLLVTGDVSSSQTRDSMYAARDLLDSLGFPYYPMGGNHDFVYKDSRAWFCEAFHAHLPTGETYYSFTHKNLHFAVLDPWWMWSDGTLSSISERGIAAQQNRDLQGARWALPDEQLAWLDKDLADHADTATIVVSHYPAIPIPDRLRRPGMKDGGCLENGGELTAIMRKHPQTFALISGHLHLHFIECVDGIAHVTTGALPEYPTEYRDIHVHDDRIEIRTLGLSDTSFAARSLIPGKDWTAGEAVDRVATIALPNVAANA
jgi:3',5'-cyclic AMP phosphodiesterase CpdA